MKHLAPACFRAFACAAGGCPDSCCRAGWEIVPDAETLKLYETLPGPAGERIRAGIAPGVVAADLAAAAADPGGHGAERFLAGVMDAGVGGRCGNALSVSDTEPLLRQDHDRVCVLLDPDGLCCVQKHFGHGALCRVCREYPRFHREFGNLTEHGISLSCPTAYALAVGAAPAWEEWEDDAPVVPNELDPERYLRLRRGRALALDLLTREALPLWRRIALLRRLAAALQGAPERRVRHDYAPRLRRWETLPTRRGLRSPAPASRAPALLARRFLELELLSPVWKEALERFAALAEAGALPDGVLAPAEPELYARWLWYALYKYWLDALDDGNLTGRVDRALGMLLLGMAMDRTLPGEGPFLRRLSREIEHCEENLAELLRRPLPLPGL